MVASGADVTPDSNQVKMEPSALVRRSIISKINTYTLLDVRQHKCYTTIKSGMCLQTEASSSAEPVRYDECCCSGHGAGWGPDVGIRRKYSGIECQACPMVGTDEFNKLCPAGVGYDKDGNVIDDCDVLPNPCEVLCHFLSII